MRGLYCTNRLYCSNASALSSWALLKSPGTLPEASQKDGREGSCSIDLFSILASSDSVVAELLLDTAEASESLWWLPASEGETGTCAETVSPWARCWYCGTLPRERSRPMDARRECTLVLDLTDDAVVFAGESTLSAGVAAGGGRQRAAAAVVRALWSSGVTSGACACDRLVASRGAGRGGEAAEECL